jgi:hypothetical protein
LQSMGLQDWRGPDRGAPDRNCQPSVVTRSMGGVVNAE